MLHIFNSKAARLWKKNIYIFLKLSLYVVSDIENLFMFTKYTVLVHTVLLHGHRTRMDSLYVNDMQNKKGKLKKKFFSL